MPIGVTRRQAEDVLDREKRRCEAVFDRARRKFLLDRNSSAWRKHVKIFRLSRWDPDTHLGVAAITPGEIRDGL